MKSTRLPYALMDLRRIARSVQQLMYRLFLMTSFANVAHRSNSKCKAKLHMRSIAIENNLASGKRTSDSSCIPPFRLSYFLRFSGTSTKCALDCTDNESEHERLQQTAECIHW